MAIIKCKMCGGTLETQDNESVAVCEYCGTKQTLPKASDDHIANLYDRANHLRRNNEFDKAMNLYEQILAEDSSDAETYWSLVLCRYGIEYVEDPRSGKRIPTINRAQFTSVFADADYKAAIEHADSAQREIYEQEAKTIDNIQKGILAISSKEEPFDVFICYKETDAAGRRTPDSVLATDLYHQLVNEGYKVFFSRITLEDKLGMEYEPYIFAALNSAKVMVVLGTKQEYFNAVWVKNEWSRYLALIRNGADKMLIPAYRDMDPYDLPEEFSHLQAQDMSKLGFMQDLIHGIKKIVVKGNENPAAVSHDSAVAPLIERIFMFIEDSDWKNANEYCERVLDLEPRTAEAYVGKLMIEHKVSGFSELGKIDEDFEQDGNFQKALRFGNEKIREGLEKVAALAKERRENAESEKIYSEKLAAYEAANTEKELIYIAEGFESILGYKDAEELAKRCREKAEEIRKREAYDEAVGLMLLNKSEKCLLAIEKFKELSGYEDADERLERCYEKLEELKIIEEKKKEEKAVKAKRNKKFGAIIALLGVIAAVFIIVFNAVIIPSGEYKDASALMEQGRYEEAITIFEGLEDYKDSGDMVMECKYLIASRAIEEKKYEEAISAFEEIEGYKNSAELIEECKTAIKDLAYQEAVRLMAAKDYEAAKKAFLELRGYSDSVEMAEKCKELIKEEKYQEAAALLEAGELDEAEAIFEEIKDYSDSESHLETIAKERKYQEALALMKDGKYQKAKDLFSEIKGYKDSDKNIKTCNSKINTGSKGKESSGGVSVNFTEEPAQGSSGGAGPAGFGVSVYSNGGDIITYLISCNGCGAQSMVTVDYYIVAPGTRIPLGCSCGNSGSFNA